MFHPVGDTDHAKELAEAKPESRRSVGARRAQGDVDCLMALKLAIPGEPGSKSGDVQYLLNGPAIKEFAQDFEVSAEDQEELDE